MTTVNPPGRFGALKFNDDLKTVKFFSEKTDGGDVWINGGFFIVEREIVDLISDYSFIWETSMLPKLVKEQQLAAFKHSGFWAPMDTLRDKNELNILWKNQKAPWKIW